MKFMREAINIAKKSGEDLPIGAVIMKDGKVLSKAHNKKEIKNTMEKLILCIEMENWEKAELFSGTVKKLVESDKDLKRKAFRLEMTIRKEDYENAITQYKELKEALASLLV